MRHVRPRSTSGFWAAAIVAHLIVPAIAAATVIDFDALTHGTIVTNQYAGAVFSSGPGRVIYAYQFPSIANTSPNIICTGPAAGGIDCTGAVFIDFTVPVNDLTFWAIEANDPGVAAVFNVHENGIPMHHPI